MATTDARTSVGSDPGTGPVYDGFISYSHAADDLLAPRLQAGLQRFAKPWWKRRAVRIFRDDASLSANPHLWSSITEAMDRSGWFVLLLSPDAGRVGVGESDYLLPRLRDPLLGVLAEERSKCLSSASTYGQQETDPQRGAIVRNSYQIGTDYLPTPTSVRTSAGGLGVTPQARA